jgi:tetratricopeptide (TPR) repeat protein
MTMDHIDRAEKLLEQAIARDPKFARAIATQADVWALKLFRRRPEDPSREEGPALEKIAARAREALALDPKLADAYVTIGNIERTRWHLDADVQNQQRAVELDPNSARAKRALAGALIDNGYMNEGLAAMSRAQVLDPLSPASLDYVVSMAMRTERYGEALPAVEQALLLSPDSVYLRTIKGLLLAMAGRREEALALVRDRYTYFAIRTYALLGERKVLETMLLESRVEARGAFAKPYLLVLLGRNEEALDALEKSELRMSDYATRIQNDPSWDPVREHPRFRALLGSLGVTEAHDRAQAWRKSNPPTLPRAS